MLQILSWNIRQGGGTRCNLLARAIQKLASDIVVLSEFRSNDKGQLLRQHLLKLGYRHQMVSDCDKTTNGVIVASKIAFNGYHLPKSDPEYHYSVLQASFAAFDIYGCYLPHKKKHRLIPFMQKNIAERARPAIIVGDINTGVNGVDQKGSSFWYQDELSSLFESGIIDAFRLKNGDLKEFSWYSHQGNGYRYDHSYVSNELVPIVTDCHYHHTYREEKYSDHSPMILKLG